MGAPIERTPMAPTPDTRWQQLGRHRFRAPVGSVIDTPIPIVGGWVAIIRPDPTTPAGWQRHLWTPDPVAGRGWLIPDRLALADIVEFGNDPNGTLRWYGIVDSYDPGTWLTLQGPYPTPDQAATIAALLLAPAQHSAAHVMPHRSPSATPCHRHRPRRNPH
jgi:hypothetical protein